MMARLAPVRACQLTIVRRRSWMRMSSRRAPSVSIFNGLAIRCRRSSVCAGSSASSPSAFAPFALILWRNCAISSRSRSRSHGFRSPLMCPSLESSRAAGKTYRTPSAVASRLPAKMAMALGTSGTRYGSPFFVNGMTHSPRSRSTSAQRIAATLLRRALVSSACRADYHRLATRWTKLAGIGFESDIEFPGRAASRAYRAAFSGCSTAVLDFARWTADDSSQHGPSERWPRGRS